MPDGRRPSLRELLAAPWRVFFVLGALHAAAAPLVLLVRGEPTAHGAGMILGFGLAAVAGYALTALPGWDGGPPVPARLSGLLAALWLLGRAGGPPVLDWPFAVALAAVLLRRPSATRRGAVAAAVLAVTAVMQARGAGDGLLVMAALIAAIGGRAMPAFLASAAGRAARPVGAVPAITAALSLAAILAPPAALGAAALAAWQVRHWCRQGAREGAGAMLAVAWAWLVAGLAVAGLGLSGATHLLGMGAMGGAVMAISGRAAMPRRGGVPRATPVLLGAFALVCIATALRVGAVAAPVLLWPSALAWAAGWLLYLVALWPRLTGPVLRPAFSGSSIARRPHAPAMRSMT